MTILDGDGGNRSSTLARGSSTLARGGVAGDIAGDEDERTVSAPQERASTEPEPTLERRGRWWVFGSFILCPCHLPITLAVLASVFGGSTLGVLVRDHVWVAGSVVTLAWAAGTFYGFRLLRRARNGWACPVPAGRR